MKIILIDGTNIRTQIDGFTQYTLSILLELLQFNDEYKYILLLGKEKIPKLYSEQLLAYNDKLEIIYSDIPSSGIIRDIKFYFWFKNNQEKFDLFYEPCVQYPFGIKGGIYTVHDILYEEFPEKCGKYAFLKKRFLHHIVHRGLKKASSIIAVSGFTKKQLIQYHKFKELNKICVIYEGYEHLKNVVPIKSNKVINILKETKKNYFLYVGSSAGHKNLHNLFIAFSKCNSDYCLVIVGKKNRLSQADIDFVNAVNKNQNRIFFTDWISEQELSCIFMNSKAFVFPSKSEGFGIPILEAYYYNVPLLCSNIPVFNEVTDSACITFNPYDIDDITKKLDEFVLLSDDERNLLLEKQKKQLNNYSWKKVAKQIGDIFYNNLQ